MQTHTGKIARLPKDIREQLNQRLENGEKGKTLVQWLNTLPEVQKIIAGQFAGHAIREQNLSEWKRGGYIDWLNQQQLLDLVRWNNETSTDLENCRDSTDIADNLGNFMSAELVLHARALQKIKDPEKRWRRFRQIARELSRLRRDDHRFDRNLLRREQWQSTLPPREEPPKEEEKLDEPEIEAHEIAEQEIAEAELEKEQSPCEEPEIVEPLETQLVRHSLGDGGNPKPETGDARWGETPSSPEMAEPDLSATALAAAETPNPKLETIDVAQAFQPAGTGTFPGPSPKSTPQPETPNPTPETLPQPTRKKLYSDVSYRSLRQPHYYDQLSQ